MESEWFQVVRFAAALLVIFIAVAYMAVALGLTVLVLLALLVLFQRYRGQIRETEPEPRNLRELVLPALILATALNLVIVPYLATPPVTFDHAWVTTKGGGEVDGAYLGAVRDANDGWATAPWTRWD